MLKTRCENNSRVYDDCPGFLLLLFKSAEGGHKGSYIVRPDMKFYKENAADAKLIL